MVSQEKFESAIKVETADAEKWGGRWVRTADDRVVQYFVCGSSKPDARILVDVHGGGVDGKLFSTQAEWVKVVEENNVRVISPNLPGVGYSTIHPGRKISDWPRTDLAPVLQQENVVGEFMVTGMSFGSPHSMATAKHFGDRVTCMGVRVPNFGSAGCKDLGLKPYGHPLLLSDTKNLESWSDRVKSMIILAAAGTGDGGVEKEDDTPPSASWFQDKLMDLMFPTMSRFRNDYPQLYAEILQKAVGRSTAHTQLGNIYNNTCDVVLDSCVDPRELLDSNRRNVVWYAEDDDDCPPTHGKWLAEHLPNVTVHRTSGYGHMGGAFIDHAAHLRDVLSES